MGSVEGGAKKLTSTLGDIAIPVASIFSVYALGSAVKSVVTDSIQYLSKLETANLGISSAFMLGGKYIDQTTGKVLESQAALTAAQADTRGVMEQLQVANMQTIATLDQLVRAYQETLPVAMAKGFNRQQVLDFTVGMVQAAGAIGMSLDMLGEETRSILTGAINPRTSRIATVLGLRNEDVAQYKGNADELFGFLMTKLEAYHIAGIESQKTWEGLMSNTKDIALQAGGQAFQPIFEAVKYELTEITSHIVTIDQTTKKITWNQEFLKDIDSIKSGVISTIAEFYRLAMLIDKAGGSLTRLGYAAGATGWFLASAGGTVNKDNPYGRFSTRMEELNKMFEDKYTSGDKALQSLADREAGLGKPATGAKVDYRQNAATEEQTKEEKAAAKARLKAAKEAAKTREEMEIDAIKSRVAAWVAGKKTITEMEIDSIKGRVTAWVEGENFKKETAKEEFAQMVEMNQQRRQLEEQTQRSIGDLRSANQAALLMAAGDEIGAMQIQFARKEQLLQEEYQKKIDYARQIGMETLAIDQEYAAQKEQLQQEHAQRQADLWWNSSQQYISFAQSMTTMGLQMLLFDESQRSQIGKRMLATSIRFLTQELQHFMFNKSKEHLLAAASEAFKIGNAAASIETQMAMLSTLAWSWASFYTAQTLNPVGGQAFIAPAVAMGAAAGAIDIGIGAVAVEATTGVTEQLILAAAWGAGGILVGALGEAGASSIEGGTSGSTTAAGYGEGTPGSPVVTTGNTAATTSTTPMVNIHIYGNVYDEDRFAREIIPSIKKALSDGVH